LSEELKMDKSTGTLKEMALTLEPPKSASPRSLQSAFLGWKYPGKKEKI
jgi:hypothetical protein